MSDYFVLLLILALLPSGTNAAFHNDRCFDENHKEIDCPPKSNLHKILAIAVPLGILVLLIGGLSIHYCLKRRRAKAFANMDAPVSVPPYNTNPPQMEQGYAGQWAPPVQHNPNPFEGGQPYAPPPGPPPSLAHGGSYHTGDPGNHSY